MLQVFLTNSPHGSHARSAVLNRKHTAKATPPPTAAATISVAITVFNCLHSKK